MTYSLNLSNVPVGVGAVNWPVIAERSLGGWKQAVNSNVVFVEGLTQELANRQEMVKYLGLGTNDRNALVTYTRYNTVTSRVDRYNHESKVCVDLGGQCLWCCKYYDTKYLDTRVGSLMGLNDHYTSEYVEKYDVRLWGKRRNKEGYTNKWRYRRGKEFV